MNKTEKRINDLEKKIKKNRLGSWKEATTKQKIDWTKILTELNTTNQTLKEVKKGIDKFKGDEKERIGGDTNVRLNILNVLDDLKENLGLGEENE